MRRRTLTLIVAVAVAAAALVVGVVTAGAQGPSNLPSVTVSQLLQNVATKAHGTTAISGDVAWTNDLMGGTSLLSLGGNQTPSGLSSLLAGGSGRIWAQNGKVRLESQGQNGDFIVVGGGGTGTVWTWDSMTGTATRYTLPTASGAGAATPASPSPQAGVDPAAAVDRLNQRLAPDATLSVSGQAAVAGRQTYTLTLTPTSPVTSVGSVSVAIDGHRWVPLQVQVFAKGADTPVITAGFKTVSFAPASTGEAAKLFTFTPPAGAAIVHKTVKAPGGIGGMSVAPSAAAGKASALHEPLTLAQARSRAPFLLTPSSTPAGIGFKGALVTPNSASALKSTALSARERARERAVLAAIAKHPTAVLDYGSGFGTVLVIESKTTAAQDAQIRQQLGRLSTIGRTTVNGVPATKLQTSLGSAVTFRQGDVRVIVVGLVPWSDVTQIAGSLK